MVAIGRKDHFAATVCYRPFLMKTIYRKSVNDRTIANRKLSIFVCMLLRKYNNLGQGLTQSGNRGSQGRKPAPLAAYFGTTLVRMTGYKL